MKQMVGQHRARGKAIGNVESPPQHTTKADTLQSHDDATRKCCPRGDGGAGWPTSRKLADHPGEAPAMWQAFGDVGVSKTRFRQRFYVLKGKKRSEKTL